MWRIKQFYPKDAGNIEGRVLEIGNIRVQVRELIAHGGFSSVYLAKCATTGRTYALKQMVCQDEESELLIKKEVQTMLLLKGHPNVITLHSYSFQDSGRGGKDCFLLLDYCEKMLVHVMDRRGGPFEERQLLLIFRDVCNAVYAMHCQNPPIAHRDLKAENVLMSADNTWKLCDFGSISTKHKVFERAEEMGVEEDVIRKHTTPAYRAPEMWDLYMRKVISEKVDIWALGCLLYRIAYFRSAFDGESKLQILNGNYRIPEVSKYNAGVASLIREMLVQDPEARPDIAQIWRKVNEMLPQEMRKSAPDRPPNSNRTSAGGLQRGPGSGGTAPSRPAPGPTGPSRATINPSPEKQRPGPGPGPGERPNSRTSAAGGAMAGGSFWDKQYGKQRQEERPSSADRPLSGGSLASPPRSSSPPPRTRRPSLSGAPVDDGGFGSETASGGLSASLPAQSHKGGLGMGKLLRKAGMSGLMKKVQGSMQGSHSFTAQGHMSDEDGMGFKMMTDAGDNDGEEEASSHGQIQQPNQPPPQQNSQSQAQQQQFQSTGRSYDRGGAGHTPGRASLDAGTKGGGGSLLRSGGSAPISTDPHFNEFAYELGNGLSLNAGVSDKDSGSAADMGGVPPPGNDVDRLKEELKQACAEKADLQAKFERLIVLATSQKQEIQDLKATVASLEKQLSMGGRISMSGGGIGGMENVQRTSNKSATAGGQGVWQVLGSDQTWAKPTAGGGGGGGGGGGDGRAQTVTASESTSPATLWDSLGKEQSSPNPGRGAGQAQTFENVFGGDPFTTTPSNADGVQGSTALAFDDGQAPFRASAPSPGSGGRPSMPSWDDNKQSAFRSGASQSVSSGTPAEPQRSIWDNVGGMDAWSAQKRPAGGSQELTTTPSSVPSGWQQAWK